jgi:hypothetical protein
LEKVEKGVKANGTSYESKYENLDIPSDFNSGSYPRSTLGYFCILASTLSFSTPWAISTSRDPRRH